MMSSMSTAHSAQHPQIRHGAEPFSADGGPLGVLLSHGFTGSPASMRPWGEHLAARGHTVRVPRLPGHGTHWQEMNSTTWQDWLGELDRNLTELTERCEFVAVAGLSMGGALALRLAQQRSADVGALVLVNPAVAMKRLDLKLVPLLSRLLPSFPGIGNDVKRPGADEIGYDRTPLKALASQLKGWAEVRADLDRVTAPLQFFHSTADHVVDDTTAGFVLDRVASPLTEYIRLHHSYHVATIDFDAPTIFEMSAEFIERSFSEARALDA